jgi:PAS domain S-box-containing protein
MDEPADTAEGPTGARTPASEAGVQEHADLAELAAGGALGEGRYRRMVEQLPLVTYIDRLDGRSSNLYTSPQVEALLGTKPEEWQRDPDLFVKLLHPDDRERVLAEIAAHTGPAWRSEYRLLARDGRVVWVRDESVTIRDESGRPTYAQGYLLDITERVEAEQRLMAREQASRESERQLRALIENIPGAVYRCAADAEWTMAFISDDIEAITGYRPSDFLGNAIRSFTSVIHPDDTAAVEQAVERGVRERGPFEIEYRILHSDGTVRWVYEKGQPVLDAAGEPVWVDGVIVDVTERHLAEEERAAAQSMLDTIVENIPAMLFAKDAHDLRLVLWNRAAEQLTGLPAEEVIGRTDADLFPAEQAEFFMSRDREVLAAGLLMDIVEESIETADGDTRILHTRKVPIPGADGRPRFLLGISQDVTELRHAQAELERSLEAEREAHAAAERARAELEEHNEQLRQLDRLKDEFVALVSHELRTPLTSILGYLDLILDEEDSVGEEPRQFLGIVRRNAERLMNLVGDLLFVAQVDAGKLSLETGPVDLASIASECVEAIRLRAAQKHLVLRLETERVPAVVGDPRRLAQLLDNLVSNAVKFTPEGGTVTLRVAREGGRAVVTVADTGIGIPEAEQSRLFERFFRAEGATRLAIQGTGLGLTISKAIAEAHGGTITVTSREGAGTTFRLELPIAAETAAAA